MVPWSFGALVHFLVLVLVRWPRGPLVNIGQKHEVCENKALPRLPWSSRHFLSALH